MIHVCYASSELYAKFAATSMVSVFENVSTAPPSVTVHVIHDNSFTNNSRDNFIYIAGRYGQIVKFYNVDQLCAPQIQFLREKLSEHVSKRFGIYSFYRLLIKNIGLNDVAKMIYLDSDTVVNLDINELWNCPIGNYPVASVPELEATRDHMIQDKFLLHAGIVDVHDYFCSGVLVMNLNELADNFFEEGVRWLADNPKCECVDQDILNNFFSKNYLKLPEKFDAFVSVCKAMDRTLLPKIYHYAGNALGLNLDDAYDRLFYTHFIKTPWFGLDTIRHAYEMMSQIYVERQNFAIDIAKILGEKRRAFFVTHRNVEGLKELFDIKDGEEVIVDDETDAIQKMINSLNDTRSRRIFFLMIDNFADVAAELIRAGLAAGEDFIDVKAFLHDGHGVPLPAFTLVKLL